LAFAVIGAAFLAVTGGEAFYADMGHFGPFPIRSPGSVWRSRRSPSIISVKAVCC